MSDLPCDPDDLAAAIAAMKHLPVPAARPADESVLARLTAGTPPPVTPTPRRRWLMRVAPYSLAASVLAVVGLLSFTGTPRVALADVIKSAEKHKLVKYKLTQVNETKEGKSTQPLVSTVYADLKSPRSREETKLLTLNKAVESESVRVTDQANQVEMRVVTEVVSEAGRTDPELVAMLTKFAVQLPRKEAVLSTLGDGGKNGKTVLEYLHDLEAHKDAVAGKDKLSGKAALKYLIEEKHQTTRLWVDAATKLPVKLEWELTDPARLHETTTKAMWAMTDFEWDPELKGAKTLDELFSTAPPKGYAVEDNRKKGK